MSNLYSKNFRGGFYGGSFNRCRHGYTGFGGVCWKRGFFHPVRFIRAFWAEMAA